MQSRRDRACPAVTVASTLRLTSLATRLRLSVQMPVSKPIFSMNVLTFEVSDIVKSFTKCIADG